MLYYESDTQAACDVMKECYRRGWISTRDGNVSVRNFSNDEIQISPSGRVKHALTPPEFLRLSLRDSEEGLTASSSTKPSGELALHKRVQQLCADDHKVVLHVHATNIVAALYAGWSLPELVMGFPEVCRYSRIGPDVPALAATSDELAIATERAFKHSSKPHIVGLTGHGVVAIGRDAWDAFEHIERLEHVCQIVLLGSVSKREHDLRLAA